MPLTMTFYHCDPSIGSTLIEWRFFFQTKLILHFILDLMCACKAPISLTINVLLSFIFLFQNGSLDIHESEGKLTWTLL